MKEMFRVEAFDAVVDWVDKAELCDAKEALKE